MNALAAVSDRMGQHFTRVLINTQDRMKAGVLDRALGCSVELKKAIQDNYGGTEQRTPEERREIEKEERLKKRQKREGRRSVQAGAAGSAHRWRGYGDSGVDSHSGWEAAGSASGWRSSAQASPFNAFGQSQSSSSSGARPSPAASGSDWNDWSGGNWQSLGGNEWMRQTANGSWIWRSDSEFFLPAWVIHSVFSGSA